MEGQWKSGLFRLFLSHNSTDKDFVSEVKMQLQKYGIDGFVAHEDIEPVKEWIREILIALKTCYALAAFLSSDFHRSNWTDQEVGYCLSEEILIIPIKMGANPYGFFGQYQALSVTDKSAEVVAQRIYKILVGHELTKSKMAEALMSKLKLSDSWEEARASASLLDDVTSWNPKLITRLESSIEANEKVREGWGVPEKIKKLAREFRGHNT